MAFEWDENQYKRLYLLSQVRVLRAEIAIDKEIADWVSQGNINVNQLLTNLMKDFYKNAKATSMLHPDNKMPRTLHG